MTESLYTRLGSTEGITKLASDLVDLHLANPAIAPRYANSSVEDLKRGASTFFITGTGGPQVYTGKDMLATHKGMNISAVEFMSVLDDALLAMDKNGIGRREQEEVLFVFYSFRSQVVLV